MTDSSELHFTVVDFMRDMRAVSVAYAEKLMCEVTDGGRQRVTLAVRSSDELENESTTVTARHDSSKLVGTASGIADEANLMVGALDDLRSKMHEVGLL